MEILITWTLELFDWWRCRSLNWLVAWVTACEIWDCNNIAEVWTLFGCWNRMKFCTCCCKFCCCCCKAICKACKSDRPKPKIKNDYYDNLQGGSIPQILPLIQVSRLLLVAGTIIGSTWCDVKSLHSTGILIHFLNYEGQSRQTNKTKLTQLWQPVSKVMFDKKTYHSN